VEEEEECAGATFATICQTVKLYRKESSGFQNPDRFLSRMLSMCVMLERN
jgi:hypothetical protein